MQVIQGDCIEVLKTLPDQSVQTIVTSPPYYGLRDYGTAKWEGGSQECEHKQYLGGHNPEVSPKQLSSQGTQKYNYRDICAKCGAHRIDDQIGLEPTPDEYVAKLVAVFRECKRVLMDDGTLWLNLGDSYNGSGGAGGDYAEGGLKEGQPKYPGRSIGNLKPKDLIGIPWRVAFALQADGWYLRSDIIWHKPNPMPESVKDRPTKSHEYIFLMAKSQRYYYDHQAIQEPSTSPTETAKRYKYQFFTGPKHESGKYSASGQKHTAGYKNLQADGQQPNTMHLKRLEGEEYLSPVRNKRSVWTVTTKPYREAHFATFPPDLIEPCILAGCPAGGVVLDPFNGSGTTGAVALKHGRDYIGIELNPEYIELTMKRLSEVQPRLEAL